MRKEENPKLPEPAERVRLHKPMGKHLFRFFAFIVCAAIFVAAFAASGIWARYGTVTETVFNGFFHRDRVTENQETSDSSKENVSSESKTQKDSDPENAIPTRPDGSILVYGKTLAEPVYQSSGLSEIDWKTDGGKDGPSVLILCTYPRESYLSTPSDYLFGTIGDLIDSDDASRCVTAIAQTLWETLEQNGVNAVFRYAESNGSLQGANTRAKELASETLIEYPSITYVIDIGLDILTDPDGNCIRTETAETVTPTAQVLAVVDADYESSAWRRDLAFAEALGKELNDETPSIYRGVSLRTASRDQSPTIRTISLKIGSCANTIEEADRAAKTVGKALSKILTN